MHTYRKLKDGGYAIYFVTSTERIKIEEDSEATLAEIKAEVSYLNGGKKPQVY